MRFLPAFASGVACAFAAGLAHRSRLPWAVTTYLMLNCAVTFGGWWALCRPGVFESRFYALFFSASFGLLLCFAVGIAVSWPLNFWIGAPLILSLAVAITLCGIRLHGKHGVEVTQGGVLLFCGILTLLSLAENLSSERRAVAIALGLFWLSVGAFAWCHAIGRSPIWAQLNLFVPPMLALIAFAWLAWSLGGMQASLVKQEVSDVHISQLQVEAQ